MSVYIDVGCGITYNYQEGVMVSCPEYLREVLTQYTTKEVLEAIDRACAVRDCPMFKENCGGGDGPFINWRNVMESEYVTPTGYVQKMRRVPDVWLTYDDFLCIRERELKRLKILEDTRHAKKRALKQRRNSFAKERPEIILQMLARGDLYICNHPECEVSEELTIDHKIAVVNGGTDELSNLQFMCKPHNSEKGAKS